MAEWRVQWRAPDAAAGPLRFEAWANASNDDRSPLSDRIHRRNWEVHSIQKQNSFQNCEQS
jgi:hypothetical protein